MRAKTRNPIHSIQVNAISLTHTQRYSIEVREGSKINWHKGKVIEIDFSVTHPHTHTYRHMHILKDIKQRTIRKRRWLCNAIWKFCVVTTIFAIQLSVLVHWDECNSILVYMVILENRVLHGFNSEVLYYIIEKRMYSPNWSSNHVGNSPFCVRVEGRIIQPITNSCTH